MNIHLATEHAGYELKQVIEQWLIDHDYNVIDHGSFDYDADDDYPDFIAKAAQAISENPDDRAIIFGGSGQGEAIVANRFKNVRAVVYYGPPQPCSAQAPHDSSPQEGGQMKQVDSSGKELDIIASTRIHNDANVLSLGARFLSPEEACNAVQQWLETEFPAEERHVRRINKIDSSSES